MLQGTRGMAFTVATRACISMYLVRRKVITMDVSLSSWGALWQTSVLLLVECSAAVVHKLSGDEVCITGSPGILAICEVLPHSHPDGQYRGGGIHQPPRRSSLAHPAENGMTSASLVRQSFRPGQSMSQTDWTAKLMCCPERALCRGGMEVAPQTVSLIWNSLFCKIILKIKPCFYCRNFPQELGTLGQYMVCFPPKEHDLNKVPGKDLPLRKSLFARLYFFKGPEL